MPTNLSDAKANAITSDALRHLVDLMASGVAGINRIADALEQANLLAKQSMPDRPAPKLWRKLEDYASFDWSSIGAMVEATDKHGATEVSWSGRVFTRRRSAEDDDKGEDIRFTRVASGTVAEKNIRWETLIKFGGNRKPAKPLRGELADKVADTSPRLEASSHATPASASTPTSKPPSAQPRHEPIPGDVRADWQAAYDAANKFGGVPAEWGIVESDTVDSLRTKTGALQQFVEKYSREAALKTLRALLAEADECKCVVPAQFYHTDAKPAHELEATVATVRDLIDAHRRGAGQGAGQDTTQGVEQAPDKEQAQQPTVATAPTPAPALAIAATAQPQQEPQAQLQSSAAEAIRSRLVVLAERCNRATTPRQDIDVIHALEAVCGSKELRQRFTGYVFGQPDFGRLSPKQKYTLFDWLRPAASSGSTSAAPTNAMAGDEVTQLLQAAAQAANQTSKAVPVAPTPAATPQADPNSVIEPRANTDSPPRDGDLKEAIHA